MNSTIEIVLAYTVLVIILMNKEIPVACWANSGRMTRLTAWRCFYTQFGLALFKKKIPGLFRIRTFGGLRSFCGCFLHILMLKRVLLIKKHMTME